MIIYTKDQLRSLLEAYKKIDEKELIEGNDLHYIIGATDRKTSIHTIMTNFIISLSIINAYINKYTDDEDYEFCSELLYGVKLIKKHFKIFIEQNFKLNENVEEKLNKMADEIRASSIKFHSENK